MRGNLLFSAATAAVLMFASNASAQSGDPPGDASTQAQFTGAAVEGEIAPAGDVDWYRMRVEQGHRYSITLDAVADADGASLDPMLAVYDAEGEQLAFNDDSGGTLNSALSFVPPRSGEVFVEARAFADASTGRYVLAGTASVIPPDDVGNDASTRARVAPGRPVTGNLEYEGDVDWYRLSVRTGQRYRITLAGAEGADNPLGDPFLRVLDRSGEELAVNDDSDGSLNSAIDFVPSASGDVFVEARAFADAYVGTYTLSVAAERLPADNYSGDRNTRGRINVGQSVESTLDFPGDRDWFRIRLQEGQSYRFTLNSAGAAALGDPLLRLYSATGQELAYDDDGGPGLNSYLEFTASTTGNYFLEARGFSDDAVGGYMLRAMAGDIPADASTDAVLSADGDWRQGVLSPAGDRDWYRIDLVEGQIVRIGLDSAETGQPLGDPYLVMYGPDSVEVARDDDGGVGLNALLEYQAAVSGPHYVEARGFSEDASGAYAISVMAGEIGDNPETADHLLPGHEGRYSMISPAGDVDWFAIELVEGRPYRFSLMGGNDDGVLNDPLLRLYDSEGNQVATDDDGGTGLNSYLTYVSVSGGTYFAAASAFGDGTGMYWLRVLDTDVPGHVYTDEEIDGAGDDRISRIDMPGDLDYFRVQLDSGARYTIELRGHGDQPLADPFVAILDENNERLASDDDSGRGLDARLRFQPSYSGTYYIQASGLGGSTGWYQVSIVRQ
jgi:hypothetical protein